jgi:trigger factor
MTYTRENLPKMSVKLTVTIETDDLDMLIEDAAKKYSEEIAIPGFRKGHAPIDMVKNKVGEAKLLEAAIEPAIRKSFIEAITAEKLETVGSPDIQVEKAAPGNPLIYSATVALMPSVTKIADFKKISIAAKKTEVTDKNVNDSIMELRRMQSKEVSVERAATEKDKVVVDLQMSKGKVPVEGGQAKDHAIYLEENYFVPGLKEKLIGMKAGENKEFTLKFPETHYRKHLAGTDVDYAITMKQVFELTLPEFNDEFAKSLGQESAAKISEIIKENMTKEKDEENRHATEVELLETLAEKSEFSEIPELLVKNEVDSMVHELEHSIEERGLVFADYLRDLKKTPNELRKDFEPQAIRRVKVALVLGKSSDELKTTVSEEELDEELDKIAAGYEKQESKERVYSPQFRDHQKIILRNRKTIDALKALMVK